MKINNEVVKGRFIKRLNRFEAIVDIAGVECLVHVPNTGRCKELLLEGAVVILEKRDGKQRKTAYELIMAYRENQLEPTDTQQQSKLISIDSQLPNKLAEEAIRNNIIEELQDFDYIKREVVFGDSRFDLYLEKNAEKVFLEVKGVTLEVGGAAMFPDAPTERGTKHIYELIKAKKLGFRACLMFVIQLDFASYFVPNSIMDPKFAEALIAAKSAGVEIFAYSCHIKEDEVVLDKPLELRL